MTAPTDGAPTVEDQLANLAQLSNDALAGLETQIVTEFTAADESNDVERMSALADALDQVQTEAQSRGLNPTDPDGDGDDDTSTDNNPDAATDVTVTSAAADTDAASKEITAAADDTPEVVEPVLEPDPAPDVPPDVPAETPAAVDEPAPEPAASAAPEIPAHSKEATAVVDTPVIPVENRPVPAVAASTRVIVAGADLRGISAGVEFADGQQVNQAFLDRIDALRSAEGRGEHVLVASVRNEFPAERQLIGGQPGENAEKIRAAIGANVQETSALIASGGYCAPLESRYDVFGMGVSDRPVRDAFPGFQATRGGIRFIAPPTLAGDTGAVGVWTAAVDTTPGGATKNVLTVACGAEQTVSISAITLEMQFGNFMTRAYPEMVAANTNLGIIAQARLAEQTLLTSVSSLDRKSTRLNSSHPVLSRMPSSA